MTLAGRVAIVTGGTGALGHAVTLRFLQEGASVCVPYVVDKERDSLQAAVGAAASRLLLSRADVTDPAAMNAFADTVVRGRGTIDILVTLVGGFAGGGLLETDHDAWHRMLELNLTSTFVAARAVVPHMIRTRRGRVITIASRAVQPPAGGFIAYTVAKAGVITFTQALAQELRDFDITVNTVLPSTMDTPGNRAAMPDSDRRGWVPVESVADTIAFLARDESKHVTGALLKV